MKYFSPRKGFGRFAVGVIKAIGTFLYGDGLRGFGAFRRGAALIKVYSPWITNEMLVIMLKTQDMFDMFDNFENMYATFSGIVWPFHIDDIDT